MSGGDLFKLIDGNLLHKGISFPGHHHASLYNVATMEPIVRHQLEERGIEVLVAVRDRRRGDGGGADRGGNGKGRGVEG